MAKIAFRQVTKGFFKDNGHFDLVLDAINLEVGDGEFVSVVGPGGNGKSTLLRLLAGLEALTSGEITVDGHPISGPSAKRGVIFEETLLYPWMTVRENVMFGPLSCGVDPREARQKAEEWLIFLGLKNFMDKYPHELSGGMQQRVAIARAIVNEPEILLCDEPFGSLDWITRELICDEFLRVWHRTRKTVLYITHALEEAVYLSQRVLVMTAKPGRIAKVVDIELPEKRWEERGLRYSEAYADYVERVRAWFQEESCKGGRGPGEGRLPLR